MDKTKDGLKGTKPFRIYYNPRLIHVDDIRHSIVNTVGYWSHKNLAVEMYRSESSTVKWKCYYCHTQTEINIKNFDGKDMFCSDHRPERFTDRFKKDPMFLRYINSFFTSVKNKIIENSKIENLYG